MKNYAIVVRPDEVSKEIEKQIDERLKKNGYIRDDECPDIVFVVGGDGTFIIAVHQYMHMLDNAHFYGIHTGTLGFYTDYRDNELEEFLNAFLRKEYKEIDYPLLTASFASQKQYAINEVRIENAARTQVMEIFVNGKKFEDFRGTGICVCTQLGSTAYNRSLGGAVIQEGLHFIEMTEISGIHHVKYRSLGSPIVMAEMTELTFKSESFDGALLGIDSKVIPLDGVKEVKVYISTSHWVRMLRGRDVSYFDRLKSLF